MDRYRTLFAAECAELLQGVERALRAPDTNSAQVLFRAAHTIKGGAGAVGLDEASAFAHRLETTLELVRSGSLALDAPAAEVFQQAFDCLGDLTSGIVQPDLPDRVIARLETLVFTGTCYEVFAPAASGPQAVDTAQAPSLVRVSLPRLEALGNQSGELAIVFDQLRAQLLLLPHGRQRIALLRQADQVHSAVRQIGHAALAARAQPVAQVFERMGRVVREAAKLTGKEIRLVCSGGETELDLTLIDRLAEPLTHLVRNAIAHGLESPAARLAAGKENTGEITLRAVCQGGAVEIKVGDDGAGLNEAALRVKYPDATALPAAELIFQAGASTAAQLTDLAGRGVGLDAVRHSINALGGRVIATSLAGQSMTFTITLPLTLAVMDGMAVQIGEQTYIVPMSAVQTALPATFFQDGNWQGRQIAIVQLAPNGPVLTRTMGDGRLILILESHDQEPFGLLVDAVLGQDAFVIKPLPSVLQRRTEQYFSSATILGGGSPALVIDVSALASLTIRETAA